MPMQKSGMRYEKKCFWGFVRKSFHRTFLYDPHDREEFFQLARVFAGQVSRGHLTSALAHACLWRARRCL